MERAADVDGPRPAPTGGIGVGDRQGGSGLGRLQGNSEIAFGHTLLHHRGWNVAPHRVRRLAHSLKRDIGPAAANRRADSPMSIAHVLPSAASGQAGAAVPGA